MWPIQSVGDESSQQQWHLQACRLVYTSLLQLDLPQTEEMEGKTSVGIMLRSGSRAQEAGYREQGPGSQTQNGYLWLKKKKEE